MLNHLDPFMSLETKPNPADVVFYDIAYEGLVVCLLCNVECTAE